MERARTTKKDQQQDTLESRLRLVIDTIPEQVWSALPDGSVDFLNQRWLQYTGMSLEEGLGVGVRAAVHPEDLPLLLDEWERCVASGGPFEKEARIRRADGEYRWFLVRGVPLRDESGTVIKWYGTSTDIEDRKQAEEELRESQEQLRMRAEQALEETGLRLAAQSAALTELTATPARGLVDFDERIRAILESCARTLGVERVSVWEFSEDRSIISCVSLFESSRALHSSGALLLRNHYPHYFEALERDRLIAADDAYTDERTREFSADYLLPSGIGAMLDVPLNQDDVTVGVLCLEHVGGIHHWSADERNFALSVANLIAAAAADEGRRVALRRLADSEKLSRVVVNTAHDAFIGVGSDGRIISWNAKAEDTFGWTREEMIGRPLAETIIPSSFREAHLAGMKRFHESGEAPVVGHLMELSALHRDGHEFPIEITISKPITRDDGFYFGAFLRDISNRRQREHELRQAKNAAEAATRAKSEFLANMSHELRTPLNGVLGYAQLMRRDRTLPAEHQESVDAISQCGRHLLELINEVLDLSRIEAGKIELEPVATDLHQLVVDVRQLIAESARRKGLTLEIHIARDLPRAVVLDGRHLRQVLINLLGNAVKFTNSGGVALAISGKHNRLRFDVSDTGIGIEPENVGVIFDAFGQTRAGAEEGGTGLGLTISQRLVRAMGGDLLVESEPRGGSLFWFDIPLIVADCDEDDLASQLGELDAASDMRLGAGEEVTALVVDDHSINRRSIAILLESMGVHTITDASGTEGIDMARRNCPEVILMDLRMKDMDGIEATRRLRADSATASIPVLAITASPFEEARNTAFGAGCSEFLAKPVKAADLMAALERQLGVRFEKVTAPLSSSEDGADDFQNSDALAAVADRLREAAVIGNISDLHEIARELMLGDSQQTQLGRRIVRLVK